MERRLLKDFQIGLVEGLIQDAITSNEKGPKDVFSKIAKAIGRRTSQGSKKDWNAMVRQKSVIRDPIGSTAEGAERRHRQSVRRYILDHQKDSLISMDPEKLVEYNPRLADMTPAARVAYAKFKISKIKQEYRDENTECPPNEVYENVPSVDVVDETKKSSIVRPRPKSKRKTTPMAGALPYPSTSVDQTDKSAESEQAIVTDLAVIKPQKTKTFEHTDIMVTPSEVQVVVETTLEVSKGSEQEKSQEPTMKDADKDNKLPGPSTFDQEKAKKTDIDDESKKKDAGDASKANEKENTDNKEQAVSKDKKKDQDKAKGSQQLKPESPKRLASPKKPGGKSKVTGEILTGWL